MAFVRPEISHLARRLRQVGCFKDQVGLLNGCQAGRFGRPF